MHSQTPTRARIIRMALVGMPEDEIAFALGISVPVLLALYINDINAAKVRSHFEARSVLWSLIRSGQSAAAVLFFIKEQRPAKKPQQKPSASPPPPKTPPIFRVLDHNGEVIS